MSDLLVVLASGGTGGHLFPAEALAGALINRGCKVALITDRRGQAFSEKVPGVALHRIPAGRLGAGVWQKAMGVAEMMIGTIAAGRLLRRLRPAVTVGFGGYPSVPTMLAATRQHIATLLHEQNALLGRANRLLAPRVSRIATSFPTIEGVKPADRARIVMTGNPVRPEVIRHRDAPYAAPAHEIRLLVTGGSQGARILSNVIPAALAQLPAAIKSRMKLVQQARPEDVERVREAYRANGIDSEIASFFHDLPDRLAKTHLLIARAGASTIAELCVVGRPAILVPYAQAADDHQSFNARALSAAGAAWVMPEAAFTPEALAKQLTELFANPAQLATTAASAHALGRPDAAERLADLVMECAGANGNRAQERAA